jgi:gentisate 1,2-dioxygenase
MSEGRDLEIRDIRERLIRIETLLELLTKAKETADNADKTANEALQLSMENARNHESLKKFLMWAFGLIVPAIVTLSAAVISVAF